MRKQTLLAVPLLSALLWALAPPALEAADARFRFVGVLHNRHQLGGQEFSAESLRDLLMVVEYRGLSSGKHTQRLELYAPDGSLYQQFSTEFTVAADQLPAAASAARADQGKGRGASPPPARWTGVETRLSVAGTWITQHSLFGAWRVEVYLDRETIPIASEVFVLTP